jgi:hypothetical protein
MKKNKKSSHKNRRVNNYFDRWLKRAFPFFVLLLFLGINMAVFIFQPSSYWNANKTISTLSQSVDRSVLPMGFAEIYKRNDALDIQRYLMIQKTFRDDLPTDLEELAHLKKTENWIYKPGFNTYDLEYRP